MAGSSNSESNGNTDDSSPSPLNWQTYSIAKLYDSIGHKYEEAYRDIPSQLKSPDWLLSQLAPHPGSRILDIGCGTGRPVAETLSSSHHCVHGIDISPIMLAVAREAVPGATFELVDFREFQEAPGSFDAVTCFFALLVAMSQDQIRETVRKVAAWLRPGGLFVFSTIAADVEHMEQTWLGRRAVFSSLDAEQDAALVAEEELGLVVEHFQVESFMPRAAEAGICEADEVMVEPQLFVHARKKK